MATNSFRVSLVLGSPLALFQAFARQAQQTCCLRFAGLILDCCKATLVDRDDCLAAVFVTLRALCIAPLDPSRTFDYKPKLWLTIY
jgi:hypothetical protein